MDFQSANAISCCSRTASVIGYGTTAITTSSSHATESSSSIPSTKRKRKASMETKDRENDPPSKRAQLSCYQNEPQKNLNSEDSSFPSPVDELAAITDAGSSSDCLSTIAEYDLGTPSTATSPDDDLISSSPCDSTSGPSCNNWRFHGDMTPQCNKNRCKKPCGGFVSQCCVTPMSEIRLCPLPALSWTNASDVWSLMCRKDELAACDRNSSMLENHPGLQPRMRAILLDWLIEVCEVYKLHRETYYLAVDYLDRYLSTQKKVQKTHLQLIGITCLFVAAKVEEIYPPKIGEFAYVTDGACQEEDILQHELLLLKALNWSISPVTVMAWLGVYMQLNVSNRTPSSLGSPEGAAKSPRDIAQNNRLSHSKNNFSENSQDKCKNQEKNSNTLPSKSIKVSCASKTLEGTSKFANNMESDAFIYPQFSGLEFVQTAQLIDLCSLDLGMANFSYSVIAAAAMSHTFSRKVAVSVSGFEWSTIDPCARWMEPFFKIICGESQHLFLLEQNEQIKSQFGLGHICPNIVTDDSHIIQTHTISMTMFDRAVVWREHCEAAVKVIEQESSPAVIQHVCPEGLLTPPSSSRKPLDDVNGSGPSLIVNVKKS